MFDGSGGVSASFHKVETGWADKWLMFLFVSYVTEIETALGSITSGVDLDIAERQLGLVLSFDYELDNFAASVGLARQGIVDLMRDQDDSVVDSTEALTTAMFDPVQRILNQVRTVKLNSL